MTRKERIARERAAQRASSSATPERSSAPDGEQAERTFHPGPQNGAGDQQAVPSAAGGADASGPAAASGVPTGPRPNIRHAHSEPVHRLGDATQPVPQLVGPITAGLAVQAEEGPGGAPGSGGAGGRSGGGSAGDGGPRYEPLGPVRGTVRTFGELCITLGLVLILFVGWQLWWTDIAADQDNRDLTTQLTDQWDKGKPQAQGDPSHPIVGKAPAKDKAFGIVYVPRFGDRYYRTLAEGVDMEPVLNRMGLGHYPGTPMPGGKGNFALAGHRVTYGKPLNQIAELRPGDEIVVQTKDGFYTYTFRNFDIVEPSQVDVLDPVPGYPKYRGRDRIMTMTACNPMFSARERYVAYATLTDFRSAADGAPDAIKDSPAFKKVGGK